MYTILLNIYNLCFVCVRTIASPLSVFPLHCLRNFHSLVIRTKTHLLYKARLLKFSLLLIIGKHITAAGVNRQPFAVDWCPPDIYLCDFAEQIQWTHWWAQPPPVTFGCALPIPDWARTRLPNYMASSCSGPCTPSPAKKKKSRSQTSLTPFGTYLDQKFNQILEQLIVFDG